MSSIQLTKNIARSWREHLGMQVATLTVLTGTFTVVTLFFFLHLNLTRVLTQWGKSVQLAVFIKDKATSDQINQVQNFLNQIQSVESIRFVSKDQAAEAFQQQMGHYSPELLKDPEFGNPLPASFEVHFKNGVNTESTYQLLVEAGKKVAQMSGVEDVSYGQGWVENYASLLRVFSSSSYLLLFVLLAGSLLVVGNAIRNAISQRREEIEVLELVGATSFHIRLPFLVEGAILGGVASLFALGLCFLLFQWQQSVAAQHLGFWGLASEVNFLRWNEALSLIALGLLFGILGSYFCVRRIATGWAAAERM